MTPKVVVHFLAYNEREIVPFAIRHYQTFCSDIVIHDLGSNDGTQKIATDAGARLVQHDCLGEFNDQLNRRIKNECWAGTDADWVICADADEMFYFPCGAEETLRLYDAQNVAVVNPYGFEMFSDEYPTGPGQITDQIKHGARDDLWYGKKTLFAPKRITSLDFGMGAHVTHAVLKNGLHMTFDNNSPRNTPATYMLHFKHLGGLERMTRLYAENQARQSELNRRMRWGNQEPAKKHAQDKRTAILSKLERVLL